MIQNGCEERNEESLGNALTGGGVRVLKNILFQKEGYLRGPVDTGRKLNAHKTFRRRSGRLLNVLCTFNLRPVSTGGRNRENTVLAF